MEFQAIPTARNSLDYLRNQIIRKYKKQDYDVNGNAGVFSVRTSGKQPRNFHLNNPEKCSGQAGKRIFVVCPIF
jgi:hypothetical protein